MASPEFNTSFEPRYGEAIDIAPGIQRLTVNNPGPFTYHGTNSYIVGENVVAVIDPGPDDPAHLDALMNALKGRKVSHIFVSHTHADHSPLAKHLKDQTGAPVLAEGPHRSARPLHIGEQNPLDASADRDFVPDEILQHGEVIHGQDWSIEAVFTPGHTANHMAFAMANNGVLFSADHVMAWATSIIAPPDGAMVDYMRSLETLLLREDTIYYPGHGGPVIKPHKFVRALRTHRKIRERAVLERIRKGDRLIPAMVKVIYRETDPRLHGAAALSVMAHIEDLVARGSVTTKGPVAIDGEFEAS